MLPIEGNHGSFSFCFDAEGSSILIPVGQHYLVFCGYDEGVWQLGGVDRVGRGRAEVRKVREGGGQGLVFDSRVERLVFDFRPIH